MENSKFGLLGEKLGHSHSPQIYEMFEIPGYELFEVPREDVHTFLKTTKLEGLNVTIPYKKIAMEQCDYLSETARGWEMSTPSASKTASSTETTRTIMASPLC